MVTVTAAQITRKTTRSRSVPRPRAKRTACVTTTGANRIHGKKMPKAFWSGAVSIEMVGAWGRYHMS
jgi:hypothetical protein